ncbi:MAG: sugar transferase [Lentisphaeria bacterium]|nr:sugar transferase [Lentisphaeria bacterium]
MNRYEEIIALRRELKRPSVFRYNRIQLRMVLWHLTIRGSVFFKRLMDIVLSIFAIIFGSPVFLLTALLVKVTSPGPIIFSQVRVGRFGRHFKFYKFRSMYIDAEARKAELLKHNESGDGVIFKMKHDPRITPVGRFIRKFSIDELPQLFNVLLGDMSLVGPRPPLPSEVRTYTLEERKRLNVTPGITCLWQVSGRSELPFSKQIALDKEYISSRSAWKDFLILLKTVPAILTGKGAW